jgi:hypothetical protein
MPRRDPAPSGVRAPIPRRDYVPPKLERLGTIRDLTQGLGMNKQFDGGSIPGQNKSTL